MSALTVPADARTCSVKAAVIVPSAFITDLPTQMRPSGFKTSESRSASACRDYLISVFPLKLFSKNGNQYHPALH